MNFDIVAVNMKKRCCILRSRAGFSLAEAIAALVISSMVLVTIFTIYSRVESSAASIRGRLDDDRLPGEVLQRIAEDLDNIIATASDIRITIPGNKHDHLYPTARLEILKTIYTDEGKNEPQKFEEIIWQAAYDYDSSANGLVLYRSHSGIAYEDKLLDEKRDASEKDYTFIPICEGVTYFRLQVPQGDSFANAWNSPSLPRSIVVTLSFAEPFMAIDGTFDVSEEDKIKRTIAIDRTRKIKYIIENLAIKQRDVNEAGGI